MRQQQKQLFYDPDKTFDENCEGGPWLEEVTYQPPTKKSSYSLLGHPVNFPFGIASSSAVINSAYVKVGFDRGFDVLTLKTQRSVPFPVNPFPNVIPINNKGPVSLKEASKGLVMAEEWGEDPTTYSMTNSFGNASGGVGSWDKDIEKSVNLAHPGQLLLASVVGTIQEGFNEHDYWLDFAKTAKLANIPGIHGIELNLSCPNVASEGIVCYSPEAVVEICRLVKIEIGDTPLLVKFGYFSKDQQGLLVSILNDIEPYIHAISAINTIPAAVRKKDGTQALPGKGRLVSGLSGTAIKWAGLDMVKRLSELRKSNGYTYEIFGMGGVMTPANFKEYRKAGADCVQSVAGAIWNPNLAAEIKTSL